MLANDVLDTLYKMETKEYKAFISFLKKDNPNGFNQFKYDLSDEQRLPLEQKNALTTCIQLEDINTLIDGWSPDKYDKLITLLNALDPNSYQDVVEYFSRVNPDGYNQFKNGLRFENKMPMDLKNILKATIDVHDSSDRYEDLTHLLRKFRIMRAEDGVGSNNQNNSSTAASTELTESSVNPSQSITPEDNAKDGAIPRIAVQGSDPYFSAPDENDLSGNPRPKITPGDIAKAIVIPKIKAQSPLYAPGKDDLLDITNNSGEGPDFE